jgi:hypothetical protein
LGASECRFKNLILTGRIMCNFAKLPDRSTWDFSGIFTLKFTPRELGKSDYTCSVELASYYQSFFIIIIKDDDFHLPLSFKAFLKD